MSTIATRQMLFGGCSVGIVILVSVNSTINRNYSKGPPCMFDHIAIIFVVNLLLYFRTLRHRFVSDDFSVWKNPPVFKNPWHKRWMQITGQAKFYSRGIRFLRKDGKSYLAILRSEEVDHLVALLIHIAICVTLYFAFGCSQISFVAALLYSTNPVNNQGTIWSSSRGYTAPILFLLLAMAVPLLSPFF